MFDLRVGIWCLVSSVSLQLVRVHVGVDQLSLAITCICRCHVNTLSKVLRV